MPADEILIDAEERMEKAVDVFKHSLAGIRTGRANPGLVDSLRVEVYGAATPIKAVAQVGASGADANRHSPLRPGDDQGHRKGDPRQRPGTQSAERRPGDPDQYSARCRPTCAARWLAASRNWEKKPKVAIRNVRRDGNKAADQEQKDKLLTEDDRDALKDEIQELTKKFETKVANLAQAKESEVMGE